MTRWRGQPPLFLALEVLPEPPFDEVLIVHEMTHLAHDRRHRAPWPETIGNRLFTEGLATAVSRLLVPGLCGDGYLWFDDVHQEWLRDCEEQATDLCTALLRDLALPEEAGHRYFSARLAWSGAAPVRNGYWVGLQAIQRLVDGPPGVAPQQLLSWDCETATRQLAHALTWGDE